MNNRNVYFIQAAYKNGKTAYLPYTVGTLIAYSWKDKTIRDNYTVGEVFFLREDIEAIVNRLDNPVYFGFSTYLWNIEYNKALAKRVKEKFPKCIIQFGGHQVSPDNALLKECNYIDLLVHNEGEEPVRQILLSLLEEPECSFEGISNVSFRKDGKIINNKLEVIDLEDYPSPYLEGVFDKIMLDHPEIEFIPLLETNRGCPNHCSYCGWGMYQSKIRMFSMDRIYKELEWVAKHKMDFLGFADANFGLFERDTTIVDWIIQFKEKYGYPKKFQVSYAKNSTSRIFEMTKKLNEHNMDKGVTLAFQSLSQEVLDNIGRSNIRLSYYTQLLKMYSEAGIATYSDLILGLPGETYESFVNGINTLLKAGQHSSLFIHILEWLPCSEMGSPAYMKKYGIKYVTIPLNQPHRRLSECKNEIPEYSRIIVETNSMSKKDWIQMNLFSICVLCFHYLGILEYLSIYLYFEKKIEYRDFYQGLLDFVMEHDQLFCGKLIKKIHGQLLNVLENHGEIVCLDANHYDDIYWTMEEYMFLEIVRKKKLVFEELSPFLHRFDVPNEILTDLLNYQQEMIKTIKQPHLRFKVGYNFPEYFKCRITSQNCKLEKVDGTIEIKDPNTYSDWKDYARYVVWYGRRGGKNLYTNEMKYYT